MIAVEASGENQIIVVPGANGRLSADHVSAALERLALSPGDVVLTGHEVSAGPVTAALRRGRRRRRDRDPQSGARAGARSRVAGVILTPQRVRGARS